MAKTITHEKALEKSTIEFEKYKIAEKQIQREQSLKEIESDIEKLKKLKRIWNSTKNNLVLGCKIWAY